MLGRMNAAPRQRGLSLVELMIGLALGLLVVAGGMALMVAQVRTHRALLIETRLEQDLHTATDIIARDLRRAGYWAGAAENMRRTSVNPYIGMSSNDDSSGAAVFLYSRDGIEDGVIDSQEQFAFRLRDGALQMRLGAGTWQSLTDSSTMAVTAFSVIPQSQTLSLQDICDKACPPGTASCGPTQVIRRLRVVITAHALPDSKLVRTATSTIRLRNDEILGSCPA